MSTIKLKAIRGDGMGEFHTPGFFGGQIVEVAYGLWVDGCGGAMIIERTHDRSDGTISYRAAECPGETSEDDIVNGIVPRGLTWSNVSE